MKQDAVYREAEENINQALQKGETELNLSEMETRGRC
jgi:hypothetical protein